MKLIGLTGKARSGKDSVGDHLKNKFNFHSYALASPIKKACKEKQSNKNVGIKYKRLLKKLFLFATLLALYKPQITIKNITIVCHK